jgi:outer membrane lipoprotein LolB
MTNFAARVSLIIAALLLNACTGVKQLDDREKWSMPESALEIKQWKLRGRLLIRSNEVLNVNINWQHNGLKDELSLFGVLGLGKKKISIDGENISLDNGDGNKLNSSDIDGFIAQQLGFVVPLTALRQWVLGRPIKYKPVIKNKNGFEQLGWQISSSRFKSTEIGVMPHKLKISKKQIKLILIIDRWEK